MDTNTNSTLSRRNVLEGIPIKTLTESLIRTLIETMLGLEMGGLTMYDTWRITVSYRASNTAGPASVRKGFSSSSSRLKIKSKKEKRALIISRQAFFHRF